MISAQEARNTSELTESMMVDQIMSKLEKRIKEAATSAATSVTVYDSVLNKNVIARVVNEMAEYGYKVQHKITPDRNSSDSVYLLEW